MKYFKKIIKIVLSLSLFICPITTNATCTAPKTPRNIKKAAICTATGDGIVTIAATIAYIYNFSHKNPPSPPHSAIS